MNSKLFVGSLFASLCAVAVACTITTERPADSSPPPSPPPPVPTAPAATPIPVATTEPVIDAGIPTTLDAGSGAVDAGTTDAGTADASAPLPPKKAALPKPKKPAADGGAATGDGGS